MKEFLQRHFGLKFGELTIAAAGMASAACVATDSSQNQTPESNGKDYSSSGQKLEKLSSAVTLQFPWVDSSPWYLTGGPHFDGLSRGVKYSLDFAPPESAPCPGSAPMANRYVTSAAPGEVIVRGDESNLNDPNHSIVEIRHLDGTISGYMHLAGIRVKNGETINGGVALGNPSCEIPPGGATSGQHVHFYLKDANENPIPIKDRKINGWLAIEDTINRNGLLEKTGEETRTADTRRCGPSAASIKACGGIRNDLGGESANFEPPTPIPPTATASKPTSTPTVIFPSPGPKPEPATPTPTPTARPEPATPSSETVVLDDFTRAVFEGLNGVRVVRPKLELSGNLTKVARGCVPELAKFGDSEKLDIDQINKICGGFASKAKAIGYKGEVNFMGFKGFRLTLKPAPFDDVASLYIEGAPNFNPLNTAKYQWMGIACLPIREFVFTATDGKKYTAFNYGCIMVFGTTSE